jgi:hypothetical protein
MKNFLIKLCSILLLSQILSSCALTSSLWDKDFSERKINQYYLDKDKQKILLIGEPDKKTNSVMYYSVVDKEDKIKKTFELAEKYGGDMTLRIKSSQESFDEADVYLISNSKITFDRFQFGFFLRKDLTAYEKKTIYNYPKLYISKESDYANFYLSSHIDADRYTADVEKDMDFCAKDLIYDCLQTKKLEKPLRERFRRDFTVPETITRIIATPFAIAADILLSPVYITTYAAIYIIESRSHRSQSSK